MKVYSVVYDVGEYDDRYWKLEGVFSSRILAENFIKEKTTMPPDEHVKEKYEECKKVALEKHLQLLRAYKHEWANLPLNKNPKFLKDKIDNIQYRIQSENYFHDIETFKRMYFHIAHDAEFCIIESELDKEIVYDP